MSRQEATLECALYVVATPIGNLGDITVRALETLKNVNVIAAEDTRVTRGLLSHFGIATRTIAVHEHNERNAAAGIVNLLQQGQSVALVTDAGTPAVSDPGAKVVAAVLDAGIRVIPIPGASALVAALSASGEGEHGFAFHGFLPAGAGDRMRALERYRDSAMPLVFYESPHRVVECVSAMVSVFDASQDIVICRELTKKFESIVRLKLAAAPAWLEADENHRRGEFVLILPNTSTGAAAEGKTAQEQALERALAILCQELPLKQAVALAVKLTGEKKNKVYDMALAIKGGSDVGEE
jgi:16S rRNA (cytidine1402-2'-O)-methyltransferase